MLNTPHTDLLAQSALFFPWQASEEQLPSLDEHRGEVAILRDLAAEIAALAARPTEAAKISLWRDHNDLLPTRPLVFCDPEIGWGEIILPEHLHTTHPFLRDIEWALRRELFWGSQMRDDYVIRARYPVPLVHTPLDWGVHETRHGGENGGAYIWDAPLRTLADVQRLHAPRIGLDLDASRRRFETVQQILGGFLDVQPITSWWWTLGLSDLLARYHGLEQMMLDMLDSPQMVHAIMARLRDGTLQLLDELQALNLLPPNFDGMYVGSGGFGWSSALPQADFQGQVRPSDMWGFGESQETVLISPAMFAEFILPYQLPILERFGLNCYGCCEPLDLRWKHVREIPRLRRVSISAWADRAKMATNLEDRFIFSYKPSPSPFAAEVFDEDAVRTDLRTTLELTRGCHLEMILKDVTTIRNEPRRVIRWVEIAREEIERAG